MSRSSRGDRGGVAGCVWANEYGASAGFEWVGFGIAVPGWGVICGPAAS
jgi:hypothetical protein